jgi:hypothetical protein
VDYFVALFAALGSAMSPRYIVISDGKTIGPLEPRVGEVQSEWGTPVHCVQMCASHHSLPGKGRAGRITGKK